MNLQEAQAWLQRHILSVKPGGTWAIPRTATVYQINHEDREFVRLMGNGDPPTEYILESIGWSVRGEHKPQTKGDNNDLRGTGPDAAGSVSQ